jgi:hypothetical protein
MMVRGECGLAAATERPELTDTRSLGSNLVPDAKSPSSESWREEQWANDSIDHAWNLVKVVARLDSYENTAGSRATRELSRSEPCLALALDANCCNARNASQLFVAASVEGTYG